MIDWPVLSSCQPPPLLDITTEVFIVEIRQWGITYCQQLLVGELSLGIPQQRLTAIIGAEGSGKSLLLRSLSHLNSPGIQIQGQLYFHQQLVELLTLKSLIQLRKQMGLVLQNGVLFPRSVYDNIAYGLRLKGITQRRRLDERVEEALRAVYLWEKVKNYPRKPAYLLSKGQQKRLMIARALALEPKVLLLDEPMADLDAIECLKIEALLSELKNRYTVVMATHHLDSVARLADYTVFLQQGKLVEFGDTLQVFQRSAHAQTEAYLTARTQALG